MPVVYWIKLKDYTDITKQGYVGVSNNYSKRLNEHFTKLCSNKHENVVVQRYYNKYKDEVDVSIIFEGSEEECYNREHALRPDRHIGWNIAPGGGKPPTTPGHTWNIGRKATDEQRQNRSLRCKRDGYKPPTQTGSIWWNNGVTNTMSKDCPGDGWTKGRKAFWWTDGVSNKFSPSAPSNDWYKGRSTPWLNKEK